MRRVPGTLSNNNMERSGVREAYNLILEDLDYAIDYGPVYKDVFSASRGLAKGFKVEVLLLRGTDEDYAKCRNWQMKYFLIMNLSWKRALRMFLKTVINLLKSCFPVSFLLKSWPMWI